LVDSSGNSGSDRGERVVVKVVGVFPVVKVVLRQIAGVSVSVAWDIESAVQQPLPNRMSARIFRNVLVGAVVLDVMARVVYGQVQGGDGGAVAKAVLIVCTNRGESAGSVDDSIVRVAFIPLPGSEGYATVGGLVGAINGG